MTAQTVFALALLAAALGCLAFAAVVLAGVAESRRGARTLDHALEQRTASAAAWSAGSTGQAASGEKASAKDEQNSRPLKRSRLVELINSLSHASVKWLDMPIGTKIVAAEDRRLLERCGFTDARARAHFFSARIVGATLLPLVALALMSGQPHNGRFVMWIFAALTVGFLSPKWMLSRMAGRRQRAVNGELPIFVDLLRLLQGVGLSLDQSLQVMINDFSSALPVLSTELTIAHRQFTTGRTREQSLHRLSTSFESDDLNAVVRLIIQVDKHGGAVQEPLKQFGDRLRESRRAQLREKIGALTVKMTGVMVVTLLPALLIMTAGPGFMAVMRTLSTTN
jgi:tight adherence protein C